MLNNNCYHYPVMLSLKDKCCVIVGGGMVAARKLQTLIQSGANVKVISPVFCQKLTEIAQNSRCELIQDTYKEVYLKGAFLVIAATNDSLVNKEISMQASCLCNNITQPELSNFTVPSAFTQGDITIALATGGMPAFTRLLKQYLKQFITPDLAEFNSFLLQQRKIVKDIPSTPAERTAFWRQLLQEDLLKLVIAGNTAMAKEKILNAISSFRTQSQNSTR